MLARFATGLRSYLSETLTVEVARGIVRERMERRGETFVGIMERGVFANPRSPYLPLLREARCELGDIRALVAERGVEGALEELAEGGVYVTFEEFKGRRPIERGSTSFAVADEDFTNPFLAASYRVESGGTTGPRKRIAVDLDHLAAQAPQALLARHAHGINELPMGVWREPLPAPTGVGTILRTAKCGQVPERWFSPITSDDLRLPAKQRLATATFVRLGRAFGAPIPSPEPTPLDQAVRIARWAAGRAAEEGGCVIGTTVSLSVRVSLAAQQEGLDLSNVVFAGGSEPPTPAKVEAIVGCGARWVPGYYSVETGAIGLGCAQPRDGNDLHFMEDSLALIRRRREVAGWDAEVDAFCFTSLLPSASKLLLNVESDDFGEVEERDCGCALGELGFRRHLRHVRSFGKLTGEGVTLVGSEMEQVLEEVLPARFGGTPLDYQLLEEEDEQAFSRLSLIVSPDVAIDNEEAVIEVVLEALSRSSPAANLAQGLWHQAGTLRVRREVPQWTSRGKLLPLHSRPHSPSPAGS